MTAEVSGGGRPASQRFQRWTAGLAVASLLLAAVACSPVESDEPLPPSAPSVKVRLVEYEVIYDEPVPAGRVVFRVENAGKRVHRLALLQLPDDFPPLQEELANDTPRSVSSFARVPDLEPGETGMFAVDLAAGQRYAMVDYSEAPDGTSHARLGLADEFRAGEQPSPGPATPRSESTPDAR